MDKNTKKLKLNGLKIGKPRFIYNEKEVPIAEYSNFKENEYIDEQITTILHTTICILNFKLPTEILRLIMELPEGFINKNSYKYLIRCLSHRLTVKGVAYCSIDDEYNKETGEKIALVKARIALFNKLEILYWHLSDAYSKINDDIVSCTDIIKQLQKDNCAKLADMNKSLEEQYSSIE